MKKDYETLFTPWKIGNVTIKNRIVLCPMGGTSLFGWMERNHFDKEAADFFLTRAKNNVGLIIPGIAPLKDTILNRWLYKNKKMFEELKVYMEEFHKTGAKLFVQLTAGFGRSFAITEPLKIIAKNKVLSFIAKPIIDASYLCASPSELPSRWDPSIKCRALTIKEIHEIIEAYALTSKMLKDAGVDGVEVHAVHEGYLLDQFTLKYTNQRTDDYGGSFVNRYRFPVEVVHAIKDKCGKDFPVSLRYSVISKTKGFDHGALPEEGSNYTEVGRDLEESLLAAKYLQDAGYDMLNCDNGTYDAWYWAHPPVYMPNNCNLNDVAELKKAVTIPLVCAGKMTLDVASEAIKEGKIDAMGVARQFLTDPAWVTKVMEDRLEDIMPCIHCHNGCFNMAHYKGVANDQAFSDVQHMSRCALNPETMNSAYRIEKAKTPKTIAVIGGGIGGMEAARVATLRGHKVTIYEKSDHLGGVFCEASNFDFKDSDKKLISWYIRQMDQLQVNIKLNTTINNIEELKEDEIIVANGAKARKLNVKGAEKCIDALSYLDNKEQVGDKVVIIGGGLTGCEIAYDLILKGKTVSIVEVKQDLMAVRGLCLANSSYLRDFFKLHKTDVHLDTNVREITDKVVVCVDIYGNEVALDYDTVICSIGYNPAPLAKKSSHVHLVGDAKEVGNLRNVIWGAYKVAMDL